MGRSALMRVGNIEQTVIALEIKDGEFPRFVLCPRYFQQHFDEWAEGGYEFITQERAVTKVANTS